VRHRARVACAILPAMSQENVRIVKAALDAFSNGDLPGPPVRGIRFASSRTTTAISATYIWLCG
jgi:hypothetical protein